jgi:hypothetical protein
MSQCEFAALAQAFGAKVVHRNGVFWRRVRPLFYRPVLPVQEFPEMSAAKPFSRLFGYQHALAPAGLGNSAMQFIMLEDLQEYSLATLGRRRQQLIRQAARKFQVRPVIDGLEFKERGFRAYRSFYERTGYAYGAERKSESAFYRWAEMVFSHPKVILLGGYGPDGLAGVSRSYWVDHTLVYATLFCETDAMKQNLGELMFHELRVLAAQEPRIKEIFVRNYQGGNSLDHYYLLRGCKLVTKPARLEVPVGVRTVIKWLLPRQYALLDGRISSGAAPSAPDECTSQSSANEPGQPATRRGRMETENSNKRLEAP